MGDVEGGYAYVGVGGVEEISRSSSQFCCEPNTGVKYKIYYK